MAAFRKFDPYTFLADQKEGGAPSEAAVEPSETLAALAALAGDPPQDENKEFEDKPGRGKSEITRAKAAEFAKAVDEGTGTLASLAALAAEEHSHNEMRDPGPTLAKAARAANPSAAHLWGAAKGLGAARSKTNPAKAAKPANPFEPALLAPGTWFDRFGPPGEPAFDQPCSSRRGLVERRGAVFVHFCVTCGAWGAFGYDAVGDRPGRWYCREHRP
jgi:hypothetical protein